jgi:hypothetical protein
MISTSKASELFKYLNSTTPFLYASREDHCCFSGDQVQGGTFVVLITFKRKNNLRMIIASLSLFFAARNKSRPFYMHAFMHAFLGFWLFGFLGQNKNME